MTRGASCFGESGFGDPCLGVVFRLASLLETAVVSEMAFSAFSSNAGQDLQEIQLSLNMC